MIWVSFPFVKLTSKYNVHNITVSLAHTYRDYNCNSHCRIEGDQGQGRIGPAAPPPLREVGPWLNHAFFYELICCETYLNFY